MAVVITGEAEPGGDQAAQRSARADGGGHPACGQAAEQAPGGHRSEEQAVAQRGGAQPDLGETACVWSRTLRPPGATRISASAAYPARLVPPGLALINPSRETTGRDYSGG